MTFVLSESWKNALFNRLGSDDEVSDTDYATGPRTTGKQKSSAEKIQIKGRRVVSLRGAMLCNMFRHIMISHSVNDGT